MKLKVLRFSSEKDSTHGLLFEDSDIGLLFMAYTLEDEHRVLKVKGETRIPAGIYNINFRDEGGFNERYKKRFQGIHKGMLEICEVPGFEYILIHCGNTDEHTAGCLLVGDSQENNKIIKDGFIGKSTNAYKRIYKDIARELTNGNEVTIEYVDLDKRM
nr:probable peptidase [uncultured Mediterranean phage uvMED]